MKRTSVRIFAGLLLFFVFALLTGRVYAQDDINTFVYTNNNPVGPNSVSAFAVGSGGTLAMVPGSPFLTGGTGSGGGFYASHRATVRVGRNILYVANDGSNNISAFKIDTTTGALAVVPGSPFASGGLAGLGISLAVTPNGRFLYAANAGSSNISAFSIASNGALTPIGSPTAAGGQTDGVKVSPNGKFLGVALADKDSVAMFAINPSTGALTAVLSSPFPAGSPGGAADVDFSCKSDLLFDGKFGAGTTVAVFRIAGNGGLSAIAGSPFTFASGSNSNVAVLTPDNQHLFVSNQDTNTITSLDVASGGGLTLETDSPSGSSPFANPGGLTPAGIGTNPKGTLLYAANLNNVVTGFHIDSDAGLTPVVGSPFSTGVPGFSLESLTVFPAHEDEGEGDEVDDSGHKGHFDFEADHSCRDSGDMEFRDDSGNEMKGGVDSYTVAGNTATMKGSGTLADGTPVQYTAIVTGNQPVIGANLFAISWITSTGSVFQTTGALTDGYIAVHP